MAKLDIVEMRDDLTHVALSGRLDMQGTVALESDVNRFISARKLPTLVDATALEFVATVGLGLLAACARGLQQHGHKLVLAGPPEGVVRAMTVSRLDTVIPIAHDVESGLAMLAGKRD